MKLARCNSNNLNTNLRDIFTFISSSHIFINSEKQHNVGILSVLCKRKYNHSIQINSPINGRFKENRDVNLEEKAVTERIPFSTFISKFLIPGSLVNRQEQDGASSSKCSSSILSDFLVLNTKCRR